MKKIGMVSTAALFLLLGAASLSAQQDEREKPPAQPAERQDQAPPKVDRQQDEQRAPEGKPAQDEKRTQQQEKRSQQDDKQVQEQEKREQKNDKHAQEQEKQQQKNEQRVQKEDRSNSQINRGNDEHRAAGNGGGRIPDDKFRSHFGRDHHFRVSHPAVVSGRPQFQYGGYSFIIVDTWPVGWDYADDCYIDYVDGEYLLFDLAHPGVSIVLNVVF